MHEKKKKKNTHTHTQTEDWECQTGAMYSSVPTKEFDARMGSAMKIGVCWFFFDFFFSVVSGIKSWTQEET